MVRVAVQLELSKPRPSFTFSSGIPFIPFHAYYLPEQGFYITT
jgi:hypothetical protein